MFKIQKSTDNQFYVTISGKNGKVIFTSKTYKRKRNAIKGIIAVVKEIDSGHTEWIEIKDEKGLKHMIEF